MLKTIESNYGSKSGVVNQLNVLTQQSDQMRKLASFNKNAAGAKQSHRSRHREDRNFIEENRILNKLTKEERE